MATEGKSLLTLTEVSEETGISMPTLQRYKKSYQGRIPAVGKGRRQRYPHEALQVFEEIKTENMARRGRPPKSEEAKRKRKARVEKAKKASATPAPPAAKSAAASSGAKKKARASSAGNQKKTSASSPDEMLSLAEVGRLTGISYPTLLRYVRLNLDSIPHEGKGRKRRFKPEAVEVFKALRASSKRGRRKAESGSSKPAARASAGGDLNARLRAIEKAQNELAKQIKALGAKIDKPITLKLSRG